MSNWCSDNGIKHQTSVPYRQWQNGLAEGQWESIKAHTLSNLLQAGHKINMWQMASAHYIRIRNNQQIRWGNTKNGKLLRCDKSHPGAWSVSPNQLADIEDSISPHPYGCRVLYPAQQQLLGMLKPKRIEGVFVGYADNTKGGILIKGSTGRILVRLDRDCAFFNNEFPDFTTSTAFETQETANGWSPGTMGVADDEQNRFKLSMQLGQLHLLNLPKASETPVVPVVPPTSEPLAPSPPPNIPSSPMTDASHLSPQSSEVQNPAVEPAGTPSSPATPEITSSPESPETPSPAPPMPAETPAIPAQRTRRQRQTFCHPTREQEQLERVIRKIELESAKDQSAVACKMQTYALHAMLTLSSKKRANTLTQLSNHISRDDHKSSPITKALISKLASETRSQLDSLRDLSKSLKTFARRAILTQTSPDLAQELAKAVKRLESDIPFLYRTLVTTSFLLKQEENPSPTDDLLDELLDLEDEDEWHRGVAFATVPEDLYASDLITPNTIEEAKATPQWEYWKEAIHAELSSHHKNQTFTEVDIKPGTKTIGSRWVFKIKTEDGKVTRFKARLVAQGFSQVEGVDFTDTWAPTLSYSMLRLILVWGLENGFPTHHLDVKTAFLIPTLPAEERVFMRLPRNTGSVQGKALLLLKSIYGLRQASRLWSEEFTSTLKDLGFEKVPGNPCLFMMIVKGKIVALLGVFVDDSILACTPTLKQQVLSELQKAYEMTDLGTPRNLLGVTVEYNLATPPTEMFLSQRAYMQNIVDKFGMHDCNPRRTPDTPSHVPSAADLAQNEEEKDEMKGYPYRSLNGKIGFLQLCTRPDIAKVSSDLGRFNHNPGIRAWNRAKRVVRYIKATLDKGLLYRRSSKRINEQADPFELYFYADADFANDPDTRRSRSGGVVIAAGAALIWWSRLQKCITLSTCEAELVSLVEMVKEVVWLRPILTALNAIDGDLPTTIFQDNQSTMSVATNQNHSRRTKHFQLKYHWVGELIAEEEIVLEYCNTHDMVADGLTKTLGRVVFEKSCLDLGVESTPTSIIAQRTASQRLSRQRHTRMLESAHSKVAQAHQLC